MKRKWKTGYKVLRRVGRSRYSSIVTWKEVETHYRIGKTSIAPDGPLYVEERLSLAIEMMHWLRDTPSLSANADAFCVYKCRYLPTVEKHENASMGAIAEKVRLVEKIAEVETIKEEKTK